MTFSAVLSQTAENKAIATTLSTIEGMDATYVKQRNDGTSFGKTFSIFSTSEILPSIAEQAKQNFVDLYNTIKKNMGESDMTISFWSNKIFIVVPSFRNRFEAKIFSRLKLQRVYEDFAVINEMGKLAAKLNQGSSLQLSQQKYQSE